MQIGVPKEVKDHEDRVGLVPSSVAELVHHGHQVILEKGAGIGSGLLDAEYAAAGATFHDGPEAIFSRADMIVKVKEPLPSERKLLRSGQVLFTYLHRTIFSTRDAVRQIVKRADLLIGAVLVPGAAAPKLVTRDMLQTMKSGAVLVDIAIDQGGCFETSHPTSHSSPTYVVDGIVHYCVANMPAAVSRTATFALNNVTLPFTIALADKGWRQALMDDSHLRAGLNIHEGQVTCEPVAEAHGLPYTTAESVLS